MKDLFEKMILPDIKDEPNPIERVWVSCHSFAREQGRQPKLALVHYTTKYQIEKLIHEKMIAQYYNTKTGKHEVRIGPCQIMGTNDIEENEIIII